VSLAAIHNRKSFPDVFAKAPKSLHGVHELFHLSVMKANKRGLWVRRRGANFAKAVTSAKIRSVNLYDVTRLKYLWHNVGRRESAGLNQQGI
jgi:hypothetical protein